RYPSSPEYHILYVPSASRRTNGVRAYTESAVPGGPLGTTTPALPKTVPLTARCNVPSAVATMSCAVPCEKSARDVSVQVPAEATSPEVGMKKTNDMKKTSARVVDAAPRHALRGRNRPVLRTTRPSIAEAIIEPNHKGDGLGIPGSRRS